VVAAVEAAVREEMGKHDSSHDFFHIERVQKTAVRLAKEEGAGSHPCALAFSICHCLPWQPCMVHASPLLTAGWLPLSCVLVRC
jgi:hypothetical protein